MPSSPLLFKKNWLISNDVSYRLGECSTWVTWIGSIPIETATYAILKSVALTKGAMSTTAIEGNSLSEDEVSRILQNRQLPESKQYQEQEVKNIINAMNSIFVEIASEGEVSLINSGLLRRFHYMVAQDLPAPFRAEPGKFAQSQRVVGGYRCPPAKDVPKLINKLSEWLQKEFHYHKGDQTFRDAVIQAIVTHTYIEWVHPFDDGNGRTGRLVEFYILLRAGLPDIASHILSNHYNNTRSEYYYYLDKAGKKRDLTEFISYAVKGLRDGLQVVGDTLKNYTMDEAWKSHVFRVFSSVKSSYKVRARRSILARKLPRKEWVKKKEIPVFNIDLAKAYSAAGPRTLSRDLDSLIKLQLVLKHKDGSYKANDDLLLKQLPRRLSA